MKVLVISSLSSEGLAFALRCVSAGHTVRLFLGKHANKTTGDGFRGLEKVKEWLPSIQWADLVFVTDNVAFMPALDRVRKAGAPVFGPSTASASLEIERKEGMQFLEAHGIECPPYKTFKTLKEAESFLRKDGGRFVFKTMGDEEDKSLSYCSKSAADMIARLQRWQKLGLKLKGACMLQEFIEGTEFAVSRWMGTGGFIGKPCENFEFKKLLSGDCGPNCGESGTLIAYVDDSKIFDEAMKPLEADLLALGHLGAIDVNCIIDDKGKVWPLEFSARPGWPIFNIMGALHEGDPAQWMLDALHGKDTMEVSEKIAAGVVLAQPDYPHSNLTKAETDGVPIYGVTRENKKYIFPQDVKRQMMPVMRGAEIIEAPTWVSAGDYLAVVTGTGRSVSQACERAYATLKELHVPDGMWRSDIGEALEEKIPELQKHGYATEFVY